MIIRFQQELGISFQTFPRQTFLQLLPVCQVIGLLQTTDPENIVAHVELTFLKRFCLTTGLSDNESFIFTG